ncbi:hypothetical protein KCU92_g368, partial [Aureobasidium melanogenum]
MHYYGSMIEKIDKLHKRVEIGARDNEAHDTVNDFLFCSRDISICHFSVDAVQLYNHQKSKNQRKAPTLPPVRRRPVRVPYI